MVTHLGDDLANPFDGRRLSDVSECTDFSDAEIQEFTTQSILKPRVRKQNTDPESTEASTDQDSIWSRRSSAASRKSYASIGSRKSYVSGRSYSSMKSTSSGLSRTSTTSKDPKQRMSRMSLFMAGMSVPANRVSVTQDPLDRFKSSHPVNADQTAAPRPLSVARPKSRPASRVIVPSQSRPGSRVYSSPQSSRPTSRVYPSSQGSGNSSSGGRTVNNRGSMPPMPSGTNRHSMAQGPGSRVSMPPMPRNISKSRISMPLENPLSQVSMPHLHAHARDHAHAHARTWSALSQPEEEESKEKKGWKQSLLGKLKKHKKHVEEQQYGSKAAANWGGSTANHRIVVGYTTTPEEFINSRAGEAWKSRGLRTSKSVEWRDLPSNESWEALTQNGRY